VQVGCYLREWGLWYCLVVQRRANTWIGVTQVQWAGAEINWGCDHEVSGFYHTYISCGINLYSELENITYSRHYPSYCTSVIYSI
jgi:hypothetical protein